MDIKINEKIEYDFRDYSEGDTFDFMLDFYSDDNFTISEDVSDCEFFMDIKSPDSCGRSQAKFEELSLADGIKLGPLTNEITISKIIDLPAGSYNQSLRMVYPDGTIKTRVRGTLIIDPLI